MSVRLAVLVAGALAFSGLGTLAAGCSEDAAPAPADAGHDAAPVVARRDAAERPPAEEPPSPTRAACLVECEQKHPAGHARDQAIAACWTASCAGLCPSAGVEAGAGEEDGGTCRNPVTTDDARCDVCTRTRCCAAWDGCFDDGECTALNTCKNRCPAG